MIKRIYLKLSDKGHILKSNQHEINCLANIKILYIPVPLDVEQFVEYTHLELIPLP
jgi:hypothetical protein